MRRVAGRHLPAPATRVRNGATGPRSRALRPTISCAFLNRAPPPGCWLGRFGHRRKDLRPFVDVCVVGNLGLWASKAMARGPDGSVRCGSLYRTRLRPWMYTWGAGGDEITAELPGDELVSSHTPRTTGSGLTNLHHVLPMPVEHSRLRRCRNTAPSCDGVRRCHDAASASAAPIWTTMPHSSWSRR